MLITLFIFLMILSAVANIIQVYLGIPEFTEMTKMMNQIVMLVITLKFGVTLLAFLVQQYDRSTHATH